MIRNILFDFDGVILDSMTIRSYGFRKIFEKFDDKLIEKLLRYHNENGGLSRYIKIKYFYNKLLGKEILEKDIQNYANNFSEIMKKELTNKDYLIADTLEFIKDGFKEYNLHIVSGSDGEELRFLCKELGVSNYFKSIHGSPTHKNELVESVLFDNDYVEKETILIGDSVNDYEAAEANNIDFYGFNNPSLTGLSKQYLEDYKELL
jgi:phosphoglycolate phosphatase-like HAD superfamily hydrolase